MSSDIEVHVDFADGLKRVGTLYRHLRRVPFLSALSMMGLADGARGSYPELVDLLTQYGAQARGDAKALFRRMAFNVLISNVDDHLRNHGFLWQGRAGWTLSPAYDLNPTPVDVRPLDGRPKPAIGGHFKTGQRG